MTTGRQTKLDWMKRLRGADLTDGEFRVLVILTTYTDRGRHNARPGVERLMADTGLSRSGVRKILKALERKGWIAATERGGRCGGRGHATVYAVTSPPGQQPRKGSLGDRERGHPGSPHQVNKHHSDADASDASPLRGDDAVRHLAKHLDADLDRLTGLLLAEGVADDNAQAAHVWHAMRADGKTSPASYAEALVDHGCTDTKLYARLECYLPDPEPDSTDRIRPQGDPRHA